MRDKMESVFPRTARRMESDRPVTLEMLNAALQGMATKADLEGMVTTADLEGMVTKADLEGLAYKMTFRHVYAARPHRGLYPE